MNCKFIVLFVSSAALLSIAPAYSQTTPHTIVPEFGTLVNGPDSEFTVNLTIDPADVDISGLTIIVGYDNAQVVLESVSDNTGQPAADCEYTIGMEQPLAGQPNVNVYVPVIMDTASNLLTPTNIAQLNFRTTPGFNSAVWLHLDDHLGEGLINGEFEHIPTGYEPLQPAASVNDWTVY